jgi:hypothetical protein
MGATVFANNNAISCKDDEGKVIASFPDVCLSPPSPPAGPIPIPYPVSSFATDTDNGSTTVKIGGKPIMLKDKSYFSKCTGDEAATKTLGMGVVSHNITGKVYFVAWSMDVKVEGLNVDRHLDLTTSNHMSPNGNGPPLPEMSRPNLPKSMTKPCKCVYRRGRCAKTPNGAQHKHANRPNAKCWRPKCKTRPPYKEELIADHQQSLNEKWYKGGCHDKDFCKKATSTPGDPKGSKEYNQLRSRCKPCYRKVYANIGRKPPKGQKDISEGSMESSKSAAFQRKHREKFGNKGLEDGPPNCS